MIVPKKTWLTFCALSLISAAFWMATTLPRFAFLDCSVSRSQALQVAEDYLRQVEKVDPKTYRRSVVFFVVSSFDRYLQKALGFQKEVEFLQEHGVELFLWKVRFFRENEKEEFRFSVSAATGEIISYTHHILETEKRGEQTPASARDQLFTSLQNRFGIDPGLFILSNEETSKLDNRTDYSFSWEKKDVLVPWSEKKEDGAAKLLTGGIVSGQNILSFHKFNLKIPEEFNRYIDRIMTVGRNISLWFRILYFLLLSAAVYYVVVRRNDLVMHVTKNFCILMTLSLFLAHLAVQFNEFESILMSYPTTETFSNYLFRHIFSLLMDCFVVTLGFLMPCLAAGSLHYEVLRDNREGAFLHYLRTTFCSRNVSCRIVMGYLVAVIMIGLQAALFELGYRYLGVWRDQIWMTQLSTSYVPFVTAFVIGFNASLTEEVAFRFFSISLGKKILKNTALAVLFSSLLWAFGHSGYLVFPMWFRALEVTLLGVFLGLIYLRFGIITVLVAHYLFDVYWCSAGYIFGHSTPYLLSSSLVILFLPLGLAGLIYFWNKPESIRPMKWILNRHQLFNLEILKDYLRRHPELREKGSSALAREIASHGWDLAVVEKALEDNPGP